MMTARALSRAAAALLCTLLAASVACGQPGPPREIANSVPRHFGYLIGDRFTQRISVGTAPDYRLDRSALPKPGRANRWLHLRALDVAERSVAGERIHDLTLHYQVMTADDTIGLAPLPRPALRFVTAASTQQELRMRVDAQHVSVSPLTDIESWDQQHGLGALRPDRPAPRLDTAPLRQRLLIYALALSLLALFWLYRIFGIPFWARSRGPFFRAWRALRSLRQGSGAELQPALRQLHRAFDETFGKVVFTHEVDAFLARHPNYAALREPIRLFFERSRRQFYGAGNELNLEELRQLAHRLSLVERNLT
jgi:mxaA protein